MLTRGKPFLEGKGIIVSNALTTMNKIYNFPSELPPSVNSTVSDLAPRQISDAAIDTSLNWFDCFNNSTYRNSFFFKGPLLFLHPNVRTTFNPTACFTSQAFKKQSKRTLLNLQKEGDDNDWSSNIFILQSIPGLRQSSRAHLG